MGPPRRRLQETVEETLTPPDSLGDGQVIARVIGAAGKNLYNVELPTSETILVELEARFRSTIWLKRGGFVIVDTTTFADRDNKIAGGIVNVIRDEKRWKKTSYWPTEFAKKSGTSTNDDEDDSLVGKMPPSESDEE